MSCRIKDCIRPRFAKGWCGPHYKRWWKYGNATAGGHYQRANARNLPPLMRLFAWCIPDGDCLIFCGDVNNNGYGRIRVNGRRVLTHRYVWEQFEGSIPNGLQINHRCDVRLCVAPPHLWLGTQSENIRDMYAKGRGRP